MEVDHGKTLIAQRGTTDSWSIFNLLLVSKHSEQGKEHGGRGRREGSSQEGGRHSGHRVGRTFLERSGSGRWQFAGGVVDGHSHSFTGGLGRLVGTADVRVGTLCEALVDVGTGGGTTILLALAQAGLALEHGDRERLIDDGQLPTLALAVPAHGFRVALVHRGHGGITGEVTRVDRRQARELGHLRGIPRTGWTLLLLRWHHPKAITTIQATGAALLLHTAETTLLEATGATLLLLHIAARATLLEATRATLLQTAGATESTGTTLLEATGATLLHTASRATEAARATEATGASLLTEHESGHRGEKEQTDLHVDIYDVRDVSYEHLRNFYGFWESILCTKEKMAMHQPARSEPSKT